MNTLRILCTAGRVMCGVAVLLPVAIGACMARAQWGPEAQMSAGRGDTWWTGIAAAGRTVHLIWGEDPILYRRSMDEGGNWSDDVVLTPSGRPVLTDPLVAEGTDVYAVYLRDIRNARDWCCRRPLGNIYFKRSVDGGATWEPEIRLTTVRGALRTSLAASGSRLDLVWMDFRTGNWDVYYRRSLDRGRTWEPEVRLVSGGVGFGAERPQVASASDSVHVVWMDDRDQQPRCYTSPACPEVYYKRSTDGGASFDADVRLTRGAPFSGRPDVVAPMPAGTVVVGFDEDQDDNQGHEQYVLRSTDDGRSFGPSKRLSFAPGDSQHTDLLASGTSVHLAWFDARAGENTEIYYRLSPDGAASWLPEERVSDAAGQSTTPLMAASAGYLHVIWLDGRTGSQQIWYRRRSLGTAEETDRTPEP